MSHFNNKRLRRA